MRRTLCCVLVIAVCITAVNVFAQYPAGAIIHLSADTNVSDSASHVTSWSDATGNGLTFVAATSAARPTIGAATINGHKTVSFDGVGNYMTGPNIFPTNHDYTVCIVVQITNFGLTNNIVSGTTHAIYLAGTQTPRFLHNGNFNAQDVSSVSLPPTQAVIIARYNQSNQYASFHINGEDGDSSKVDINPDSTVYLGAYEAANLMGGNLAEVMIYDRYLSDTERVHLEDSLFKKYAIAGPQPPDTTFTEVPRRLQLYARDADDSATVAIRGSLRASGFDSLYVRVSKNDSAYWYSSVPFAAGKPFALSARIHAELAEYSFTIGAKGSDRDSVMRVADSVVCGDAILIDGQSNSIVGIDPYQNEYCRTFGVNFSSSKGDTAWSLSVGYGSGGGSNVGGFGLEIQRDYVEKMHLPTALITGSVGGTAIEQHLPNVNNPTDLTTIYGSMLYRVRKSGLVEKAKALFWYQGESNSITNYFDNFKQLSNSWRIDYPSVQKFYVVQVRPGCAAPGNSSELRDLLRSLSKYYPDVVTHTTMGLPDHDGCHFIKDVNGYHMLGDQLFALVQRDIYHSTDTVGINSPDILSASYTDDTHTKIRLLFNTSGNGMSIPADSTINGITASIKDYFFIGSDTSLVKSLVAHGDTIVLQLAHATDARTIAYLPDTYYNDTNVIYEGPWLRNNRGLGAFCFWGVPITYLLKVSGSDQAVSSKPLQLYPNPARDEVTCAISLQQGGRISLRIFDDAGREVLRPVDEYHELGNYELPLDLHSLPSGPFIVRLEVDGTVTEQRLTVMH